MGIVADTSVFTVAERRGWSADRLVAHLGQSFPGEAFIISTVSAAEMVHGIFRARLPEQSSQRRLYVSNLLSVYAVRPFGEATAWIAGRLRGEQAAMGNTLPLADSLIAATALKLGYGVLTHNVKDFERVPGIRVLAFGLD